MNTADMRARILSVSPPPQMTMQGPWILAAVGMAGIVTAAILLVLT